MTEKPLQAKIRYTRALGTPYVRGKPVEVGKNLSRYKADAPITIGDTVPGQEIYWFEVGNLLIAFEPVLYATHYGTMKELELVHGRQITIDGKAYTCRLIQALQKDGPNGELRMSDEMEEFERVANGWSVFSRQCFFGPGGELQPDSHVRCTCKPCHGLCLVPGIGTAGAEARGAGWQRGCPGCRPIWYHSGVLEDVGDYDLLIGGISSVLIDPSCMCQVSGEKVIVSCDAVSSLQGATDLDYSVRLLTAADEYIIHDLSARIQNEYLGGILSMEGFPYGLFAKNELVGYCMICPAHGSLGLSKEEAWRVRPDDGLLIDDFFIQPEHSVKGRMEQLLKASIAKVTKEKGWEGTKDPHWVFFLPANAEEPALLKYWVSPSSAEKRDSRLWVWRLSDCCQRRNLGSRLLQPGPRIFCLF